jgi:hippurate hydrolase
MDLTQKLGGLYSQVRKDFGDKMVTLRREIHWQPELGFDTERTAAKVVEALAGLPVELQTSVAQNGVVALLRGANQGPPWL